MALAEMSIYTEENKYNARQDDGVEKSFERRVVWG